MKDEEKVVCEKTHASAEQYNLMIWTIFSVGVAISLYILQVVWPDKMDFGGMQFFKSILGFLILFYSILAIESFNQKKRLLYKIYHSKIKDENVEPKIKILPFFRFDWIAEIILFFILVAYVILFGFIWSNNSLARYGEIFIFLELPMFIISIIFSLFAIFNWILRPKDGGGNFIEKIRIALFESYLKSYNEIVERVKR